VDIKDRDNLVAFYSARFGIAVDLSRNQMMAESSGNPNAVSKGGARGLFQLMPQTAADLLFEEEPNIMLSRFYLRWLYDRVKPIKSAFSDSDRWRLAIAAYNAGPGLVHRVRVESSHPDSGEWRCQPDGRFEHSHLLWQRRNLQRAVHIERYLQCERIRNRARLCAVRPGGASLHRRERQVDHLRELWEYKRLL
jgi:hypothetical protein